jgi:predicted PurR-regulated permease PerM
MEEHFKVPFYAKVALVFIGLFAFLYTLYAGQQIILPLLYATIIAILLNPLVNLMIRWKINKVIAILIALVLALTAVSGIFYIISRQFNMLSDTYPQLKEKFNQMSGDLIQWTSSKLNIKAAKITAWIKESQLDAIGNIAITEKLSELGRWILVAILLPVYIFMILYYKTLLLEFIRKVFRKEHQESVAEVLSGTRQIIQSYVVGLFFEMLIVAVLNSAGLLLLGIQYAIILGILGAILNIIPYLGGIIATALPMIIALVTKSPSYAFLVLLLYLFIQFVDNHFIIPNVVAKRVRINALVSIIVVLAGGALWGIPGMFLSIPLTAIVKVIFDHVESLKPWGYLLGNIVPTTSGFTIIKQKLKIKTMIIKK